jgi:hypothetical protein
MFASCHSDVVGRNHVQVRAPLAENQSSPFLSHGVGLRPYEASRRGGEERAAAARSGLNGQD